MRFLTAFLALLVLAACSHQREFPEPGKVTQGRLTDAEILAFFLDQTGVTIADPATLPHRTGFYCLYREPASKSLIGYHEIILKVDPKEATRILEDARTHLKAREKSLYFEHANFMVGNYGGLSIPKESPVLYWDDDKPHGESFYLEIDPKGGVVRLSHSVGKPRDELAQGAADKYLQG